MDDGGRCLLDVINDPLLLQSFLECGSDNFPKGHHNGDNSLSAAAAGSTLLIGHHRDVVTSTCSATTNPSTLLSLASLKPSLESMGFNCQVDKQSLMGHITVTSAVGTSSVISPLPAVYPLSRISPSPQHQLYSIKSPSQGSSPAQNMPPPSSPLQSPTVLSPTPRNSSPTVVLQTPQTMHGSKGQQPYHQQPTIIPLSMHQQQQLSTRLSALSGHVVPTTSGVPSVVQFISASPQPAPVVARPLQASVRPIQPKQPQQILPKPPKSNQLAKQVAPNHPVTPGPRAVGVSLNPSTNSPVVIGQGQPGVFAGPQGTIVLNQFLPGMGHGPFVIQGNIGNMQGVQLTLRPTQPGHYTTGPATAPQATVSPSGSQNNATLIAALQAPSQHAQTILGQPKASLSGHHTIVFPGGLTATGQNINLTSQASVIHSSHPNQGILTQRPNIFLAPRMLGPNQALQLQQIQTPQGPITIALAPSHNFSLQQLASLQGAQLGGPQLTSVPGMMGQGVFSNVALRHQPSPVPASHSPFAPKTIQQELPIQQQQQQQHHQQQHHVTVRQPKKVAESHSASIATQSVTAPVVASTPVVVPASNTEDGASSEEKKRLAACATTAVAKPSLNLAELLKEHGIVPETTPPPSPNSLHYEQQPVDREADTIASSTSVRDPNTPTSNSEVVDVTGISMERLDLQTVSSSTPSVIQQPTVSSSVQDHPNLLSRLNSAPAAETSSLVLRSCTPPDAFVTSGSQVILGLQQRSEPQMYVPMASSKLVPLVPANPVLVKTSEAPLPQQQHHNPPTISSSMPSEFQNNADVAMTVEKNADNCKFNQDVNNKTRVQASSNFIGVVHRPPVLHHVMADQNAVLRPDTETPFCSGRDACTKLMRYHVYDSQVPSEEDLRKTDDLFEMVSQRLLERRQRMINKYRYLLLKESMKPSPSSENVMLERMFIHEEIPSLKLYKKMLSDAREMDSVQAVASNREVTLPKESDSREEATAPVSPPPVAAVSQQQCDCHNQNHSLKRDRTKSPCDDEPSSKKIGIVKPLNPTKSPESTTVEEVHGEREETIVEKKVVVNNSAVFNHHDPDEDIVSKIRKELNISPIDHHSEDDFDAHSGNLDFFEPSVTRSDSSCGSPFPYHHNSKSGAASLGYDFDVMDGHSEWSAEAYVDREEKLFVDSVDLFATTDHHHNNHRKFAESENARTFGGFRIAAKSSTPKINCIRSLEESSGMNGEFLGSLDEDSDSSEVNAQVQTAIKSILDVDAENHSYYVDGDVVFDERRIKVHSQRTSEFDENLNADMSGNSLESDAALDEAVRSILL